MATSFLKDPNCQEYPSTAQEQDIDDNIGEYCWVLVRVKFYSIQVMHVRLEEHLRTCKEQKVEAETDGVRSDFERSTQPSKQLFIKANAFVRISVNRQFILEIRHPGAKMKWEGWVMGTADYHEDFLLAQCDERIARA